MRLALLSTFAICLGIAAPATAQSDTGSATRNRIAVEEHVLPRFAALTEATDALASADTCDRREEWAAAVEAWSGVSHLRFGPTEAEGRAFGLAFWPDPRGATPGALASLLDAAAQGALSDIAEASVAGRGLYALEFLLFDPAYADAEGRCALIDALATDADATAKTIEDDWTGRFAALMTQTPNDIYRDDAEVTRQFLGALQTGLEFTADSRLGRPLGTYDRPRPARAEMWRSERSLANVAASLRSLEELADILAADDAAVTGPLDEAFARANERIDALGQEPGGPDFSLVDDPLGRFAVEVLQEDVRVIGRLVASDLGPSLGVSAGFSSLDGD